MQTQERPHDEASPPVPEVDDDFARKLVHRWFVQYNPLYLLSAALVLAGLTLVSREMAQGALGALGVAAVAELYAFALIAGAALLARIGERRAAVMLALLVVLFQCDLTLHVETCAYLGMVGRFAALGWVALFVVKLLALARALELRLSKSAILVPTLGAIGLALVPHLLREAGPEERTSIVAVWAFAVGAAGLWTSRRVHSAVELDARGRRALRASWATWSVLALGHVAYWSTEHEVRLVALIPVAVLLWTRWATREATVWGLAATCLVAVGVLAPSLLSVTAFMAAAVLALRALRAPVPPPAIVAEVQPYRGVVLLAPPDPSIPCSFAHAAPAAMQRLLLGAAVALHLSLWTFGWAGAGWPEHQLALDVLLTLAAVVAALWSRRLLPSAPLGALYVHLAVERGWLTGPSEWGLASIVLGFVLLAGALSSSFRHRKRAV